MRSENGDIDGTVVRTGNQVASLEAILFENCDCCPHAGLRWHAAALGHPDAALDVTRALATERAAKPSNDEVWPLQTICSKATTN